MTWVYAVVGDHFADKGGNEAHVVDALPVRDRCPASVGPAEVDAVRVDDGESVRVGHGVVMRECGLVPAGGACRVQIDDQTRRVCDTGRHVNGVGPGDSPVVEMRAL